MTSHNHSDHIKQIFVFVSVLTAALVIRMTLFTGMIRSDDFQYAHAAFELAHGNTNLEAWAGKVRIGFYGPVAALYMIFGPSDVTTLLYPVFCSLLSIVFIYGIGRLLWDEGAGLLSALTWTLLPYDIFLATDLLPDVPQAAFDTGVVFFLLLGEKTQNKNKYIYYGISFLLMIWAILVKEPSIIVLFFVICYIFYKIIERYQERLKKINVVQIMLNKPTTTTIIAFVVFCILFGLYAAHQPYLRHFITLLTNTSSNLAKLLTEHLAYRHLSTLFIIAFSSILLSSDKKKSNIFVLLWISVIYLYYEWGTINPNPLLYSTIDFYTDARYAHFVFTPISVLTGRYLSQNYSLRISRMTTLIISLLTIIFSISIKLLSGSPADTFQNLSAQSVYCFILICIVSPIVFHSNIKSFVKNSYLIILTGFFLLSTFNVTHNLLNLYNNLRYPMENIQEISQFLVTQPKAPVYVLSRQNALAVNYFSNFELGYNDFGENREGQMVNVIGYNEIENIEHGYLVVDGTENDMSIASGWNHKMEYQHTPADDEELSDVSHTLYIY